MSRRWPDHRQAVRQGRSRAAPDVTDRFAELDQPLEIATYLLAPGRFVDVLNSAADGIARVAAPIGLHPGLVRLVWQRYDEAVTSEADAGVR